MKITRSDWNDLRFLKSRGYKYKEIAAMYDVTERYICCWFYHHKETRRTYRLTEEDKENIKKLMWTKKPKEIAAMIGCSTALIRKRIVEWGVPKHRVPYKFTPTEIDTLLELYCDGKSDSEIARELGRSVTGVAKWVKRLIKQGVIQ